MREHLSETDVRRYAGKEIGAEELLAVCDHLEDCASCRILVSASMAASTESLRHDLALAAIEPEHLTYENLESFVDQTTDDIETEILRGHLDSCVACAAELSELESFRNEIRTHKSEGYAVPISIIARPSTQTSSVFKIKLLQIAVLVAVAISSSLATRWFVKRSYAGLNSQVETVSRENEVLRHQLDESQAASRELLAQLHQGQGTDGTLPAVELRDGSGIIYDRDGNLTVPAMMPLAYKTLMERSLAAGSVKLPPWLSNLRGKRGVLMGPSDSADEFKLEAPLGSATLSDRPEFRWKKLEGASNYIVSVYDEESNLVAKSKAITGNEWRPDKRFKRGKVYLWQVEATKDGHEITAPAPPAPEAKFKVIDSITAAELEKVLREYADAHLLLGLLYARAGDSDHAKRELEALSRSNPQSRLARKILKSL